MEGEGEVAAMEHRLLASTVVMDSSSMEEEEDTVHRLSSKARMAVDMVVRLLRVSSKADMVSSTDMVASKAISSKDTASKHTLSISSHKPHNSRHMRLHSNGRLP